MSRKLSRKLSAGVLCLLLVTGAQVLLGANGCYTPWATKVVLPYFANGQPGLAAFNGKLILTWGDQTSNWLNSAVSTDGVNWTNQQSFYSFPQVNSSMLSAQPPYASGGVNMTASTYCGHVYTAYANVTGLNIYGARSADGISWQGGNLIWSIPRVSAVGLSLPGAPSGYTPPPSGYFSTSSPALYGNNSTLPIGFAFPQYIGWTYQQGGGSQGGANTWVYGAQLGQFNCDFSNPRLLTHNCLFWNASTGTCQDSAVNYEYDEGWVDWAHGEIGTGHWVPSGPWSPLWTGAGGTELRAVGQGNPLGNIAPPLYYSTNQGNVSCVGTNCAPPNYAGQWTNNGVGGAVNPADGTSWLVWSCRTYNGDTCGGTPYFNLYHVTASTTSWCTEDTSRGGTGEWSIFQPAMTFFNGKLWLAWRGGSLSGSGNINVASINPLNIGWNGPPPPPPPCQSNGTSCSSSSQCCSGHCLYGWCGNPGCQAPGTSCGSSSVCCSNSCVYNKCK